MHGKANRSFGAEIITAINYEAVQKQLEADFRIRDSNQLEGY